MACVQRRYDNKYHSYLIGFKKVLETFQCTSVISIVHSNGKAGGFRNLGHQEVSVAGKMLDDAEITTMRSEEEFQI
jgi:hypothetical protein